MNIEQQFILSAKNGNTVKTSDSHISITCMLSLIYLSFHEGLVICIFLEAVGFNYYFIYFQLL